MNDRLGDEEWLDVVDEQGNVFDTARRRELHSNPNMIHRAVHIIVTNPEGHIFLQKRAETKDIQPGKWDTSVGGHLAIGEDFNDAAKRELYEELGISGVPLEKLYSYLWKSDVETESVRTFLCTYAGEFRLDADEIETGRYWTNEEIRSNLGKGEFTPNFEEEYSRYIAWKKKIRR